MVTSAKLTTQSDTDRKLKKKRSVLYPRPELKSHFSESGAVMEFYRSVTEPVLISTAGTHTGNLTSGL